MANFNFNKVILGGRLTADVEQKTTQNGVAVAQFSIAINRRGKDAQTDFINCVAWRGTAEFVAKYFRKGSSICVVGELQTRTWTDKDGGKRYATEVIASEASFVDSKSDNEGNGAGIGAAAAGYVPTAYTSTTPDVDFENVPNDDDLPF